MVAVAILAVFFIKGVCDYCANYLINYVGFSAVTDLRQTVFDRVVHQDAHFFEVQFDGARDVVDHERPGKDSGGAIAHFGGLAAAKLHGAGLARGGFADRLETGAGQPDGVAVRAGAHAAAGPAHPPNHAQRAGQRCRVESGVAGDLERPSGSEVFRRRRSGIEPFPRPRREAAQQQPALRRAAGDRQSR